MFKFTLVLLSLSICGSFAQDTSLDKLLADIFTTDQNAFSSTTPLPQPGNNDNINVFQPKPTKSTVLGPNIGNENSNNNNNNDDKYDSCGYEKECVPRWLCSNDTINTSGENIIDIRIDSDSPCKNYLDRCCDIANKRDKPPPIDIPEEHNGCGFQNPNGVGFKITGAQNQEAEFGEFPWMVAILREESSTGTVLNLYECGGALIAPSVILTAAHCVHNKEAQSLIVRAGEWDTQTKNEIIPHEDRYVKEIVYHEEYNKGALYNDIALLFLESPFTIQENIQPVCLPSHGENFDVSRCYATGWGKNKFGKDGEYQVILKKIDLPVVNRGLCQQHLRKTRLGKHFILHESFMCAGGEKDKDTCKGDGGSPLVCPIPGQKDRFYQAGIVAWGIGCGQENIPGVYASVAHLRPWIDQKLNARQVAAKYFTP